MPVCILAIRHLGIVCKNMLYISESVCPILCNKMHITEIMFISIVAILTYVCIIFTLNSHLHLVAVCHTTYWSWRPEGGVVLWAGSTNMRGKPSVLLGFKIHQYANHREIKVQCVHLTLPVYIDSKRDNIWRSTMHC